MYSSFDIFFIYLKLLYKAQYGDLQDALIVHVVITVLKDLIIIALGLELVLEREIISNR